MALGKKKKKEPAGPAPSCSCGAPSLDYLDPSNLAPLEALALRLYTDPETRKSYCICKHGNAFEYAKVSE